MMSVGRTLVLLGALGCGCEDRGTEADATATEHSVGRRTSAPAVSSPREPLHVAPHAHEPQSPKDGGMRVETSLSIAELEADLGRQLAGDYFAKSSPVLPCAWPSKDACVKLLRYRVEPLPTGIVQYAMVGPMSVVQVDLATQKTQSRIVNPEQQKTLGVTFGDDVGELPSSAEQALLDVVLGKRTAQDARPDLTPYAAWFRQRGPADAVRQLVPDFVKWLDG